MYQKVRKFLGRIKRWIIREVNWESNLIKAVNNNEQKIKKLEEKLNEKENKINNYEEELNVLKNFIDYDISKDVENIYYFHSGSNNCGCEALLKTLTQVNKKPAKNNALITFRRKEDINKNIGRYIKYIVKPTDSNNTNKPVYMGDTKFDFEDLGIEEFVKKLKKNSIAFSIGGDNYCYGEEINKLLAQYNKIFHKYGIKTILQGCSINEEVFDDSEVLRDLNLYDMIIARETITYNNLINNGITKNTHLIPDSAFILEKEEVELPKEFIDGNTVGINVSPLIKSYTENPEQIYLNYVNLIKYILEETDMSVALIPHVFWDKQNDLEPLQELYDEFSYTNRICIIKENNASKLKGYISSCKIFVGARTHATIAAYSSCVPTLVVGYSVKSKGIAKDLFGSYEKYVISVNDLNEPNKLLEAYKYIEDNCDDIKKYLNKKIPEYIKPLKECSSLIEELRKKKSSKELPQDECTGCRACANACPKGCISFSKNKEGFLYPQVDYSKCIHCGKCIKACPVYNSVKTENNRKCFAVKAGDKVRKTSSSGGVFYHLADEVLSRQGVVFGSAFDENLDLKHIAIADKKDLHKLQGSKYLQSNTKNTYKEVKEYLNDKRIVLYVGTPCQIKGLHLFLNKEYDNLYTVDVICHGVPSPLVFSKYISKLEEKYKSNVVKYSFRNKDEGWKNFHTKIEFEDGNILNERFDQNVYMKGFLRNLYLRKSCYNCSAKGFTSGSDMTLGDFWGIQDELKEFDDDKGCSVVFINTKRGEDLFNQVQENFDIKKVNDKVLKYNKSAIESVFENKNRTRFFNDLDKVDIEENINNNLYDEV
ncbi:MAG: Coenzyme F420 hydrogenase/dehydrogenase, beta subunit C-terminal domain [Bacilli bacterium]|nr:Coenzyme F420 hydrogenase/dehydrogenase, beta subunit C-terminal domain [Bacilli bacterium]